MSALRVLLSVSGALVASVVLSACCEGTGRPPPRGRTRWSFESPCSDGPACDFVAERGSASASTLFHSAERGLDLGPDTVAAASLAWGEPTRAYPVTYALLARCDEGTTLAASFEVGDAPAALAVTQRSTARVTLRAYDTWTPIRGAFMESFAGRAMRFRLITTGRGACQVDSVELFDRFVGLDDGC